MSTTSSSNMVGFWELLVLSVRQRMCKQRKKRMKKEKNDFVECIDHNCYNHDSINKH